MFPIPARVLFPAIVSLISGLWALAEWRAERAGGELLEVPELDEAAAEARSEAERRRLELAERKQRLAEQKEARLARRPVGEAAEGGA
jgi:hypothetical protein